MVGTSVKLVSLTFLEMEILSIFGLIDGALMIHLVISLLVLFLNMK